MELTAGWILLGIAVIGIIFCAIGLLVSEKFFKRQRKRLLQKIETE